MMLKLKLILAFILALILGSNAFAETTSLALDSELETVKTPISMIWPMLPGESVNDVARLFYPKNVVMQRLFVRKTLRLNTGTQHNLIPTERFEEPTLLVIPTLKSLSKKRHVSQSSAERPVKHRLQITTDIENAQEGVPAKLKEEYAFLVSKNELLNQQLMALKDKIVFLETKLNNLKLIWEKTLTISKNDSTADNASAIAANSEMNNTAVKQAFKNLNRDVAPSEMVTNIVAKQDSNSILSYLNMDWVKAILILGLLGILGAFLIKKYREHMFAKMDFITTEMQTSAQENMGDSSGNLKPNSVDTAKTPEAKLQAQAAKDLETRLDSTLTEAKLLMSINRHQDAIAHLKLTIESQPKATINHWLYLLEIFRKLNLKADFEVYAKGLHDTYNVMTPVWYETEIPIVVPQSLEEFPHIIEKLCSVWAGDFATMYLRGLITDNRGGERSGFGRAVLDEILMLIALLDIRKSFTE